MFRKLVKIVAYGLLPFVAGALIAVLVLPRGGDQLSRSQVRMLFGEYGLQQYDRILKYNQRSEGLLQVGDLAPDIELKTVDGGSSKLSASFRDKPLVLSFGSYT